MDQDRLRALADSQLDHVLIALRAGDHGYNIRDVLDPWWCYERGAPSVSTKYRAIQLNAPCPWKKRKQLVEADATSEGAQAVLAMGEAARKPGKPEKHEYPLVVDHSVPLGVIGTRLWRTPDAWTRDTLRTFLRSCFRRALLTCAENKRLNEMGLNSKMPTGWEFGQNPFERYDVADIGYTLRADV